jgi:hypothetical protein
MKLDPSTTDNTPAGSSRMTVPESTADFNQWLQSMLAVARLPGGLPIEFRRKVNGARNRINCRCNQAD